MLAKPNLRLVKPTTQKRAVTPRRRPNSEFRSREHLTETEVEKLIEAAKDNRYGHRDATMLLVAYPLLKTHVRRFRFSAPGVQIPSAPPPTSENA